MLCENIGYLCETTQMGFFFLRMFQDKYNRDYFQCNRYGLHCYFVYSSSRMWQVIVIHYITNVIAPYLVSASESLARRKKTVSRILK